MQRLKLTTILTFIAISIGLAGPLVPAYAMAAPANYLAESSKGAACAGLSELDSSQSCGTKPSQQVVGNLTSTVVSVLSIIIGVAAIIMIIIAGLRYVISGGDSNGVSSAKNTLIYALVGLVVAALAQFLAHYVLNKF